jgi:hypothetical protein
VSWSEQYATGQLSMGVADDGDEGIHVAIRQIGIRARGGPQRQSHSPRGPWISVNVELVEGRGERCWPRPGRVFAAAANHSFADLSAAIEFVRPPSHSVIRGRGQLDPGSRYGNCGPPALMVGYCDRKMNRPALDDNMILLRRLRLARIAMLVQAGGLVVVIGLAVPSYLDQQFHPMSCGPGPWCIDLRGLAFELSAVFLGPPALLLLATAWLWRRPRKWPAALPLVLDVVLIGLVIYDASIVAQSGYDDDPPILAQVVFGLVPAAVGLALTFAVLRPRSTSTLAPKPGNMAS